MRPAEDKLKIRNWTRWKLELTELRSLLFWLSLDVIGCCSEEATIVFEVAAGAGGGGFADGGGGGKEVDDEGEDDIEVSLSDERFVSKFNWRSVCIVARGPC